MKQRQYIRLENTFEQAMSYENSPQMNIYNFNGVQLLPNSENAYTQVAYVELENFTVSAFNLCSGEETILPPNLFQIEQFQDEETGENAIYWSYKPDGTDLRQELIYLRFKQGTDYIYSSPFYLTNDGGEYTSRWDYWDNENDTVLSTQLNIYYIQPFTQLALDQYSGVYVGTFKSIVSGLTKYERWRFGIVYIELFQQFAEMMQNEFVYCNYRRANLYTVYETPELQGRENFAEADVDLYIDKADIYDPNYQPYVPPPDPPTYEINLIEVLLSGNNATTFNNFTTNIPNPITFQFQYSIDQVNWTQSSAGTTPPQTISTPNANVNNYYYRIWHSATNTYSNIVQLSVRSIVITNMTSPEDTFKTGMRARYRIYYTVNNFTTIANTQLTVEYSVDGITYGSSDFPLVAPQTGASSITFTSPGTAQEFKYFRLRYAPYGIASEPYQFQIDE